MGGSTGDIGRLDEDGVLWFEDRKKDMVKTGGENVASLEVEEVLMEHPDIEEAAIIGIPHPKWNEGITAVVSSSKDDLTEDDILDYVSERKAGFKVPKTVVFVEEFPGRQRGKSRNMNSVTHTQTSIKNRVSGPVCEEFTNPTLWDIMLTVGEPVDITSSSSS